MSATLHFVTPDLFGPIGGIARISRATALALSAWCAPRGHRLVVHALADMPGDPDPRYLPPDVASYRPYAGDRRALAAAVARAGWGGHVATVFGHVNLAVAGLLQPPTARQALVAHGIEIWDPFPAHRLDRRLDLRRQRAIWAISEYTAERVRAAHPVGHGQMRVVPNALDPCFVLPPVPAARQAPRLLAVSSLAEGLAYKGIDRTLEALAQLPEGRRPPFDVVGEGSDRARLQALSASLGLNATVRFLGRVDDDGLAALYREASVFVLPSTREGFGLVFVEAMAHALPVITAAAGAAPEVVIDGETGRVVDPADTAGLAAAIASLAADPDGAHALGLAGRARLEARYLFPTYRDNVAAAMDALTG